MPKYKVIIEKITGDAELLIDADDYNKAETQVVMALAENEISVREFKTPRYKLKSTLYVEVEKDDFRLSDGEE